MCQGKNRSDGGGGGGGGGAARICGTFRGGKLEGPGKVVSACVHEGFVDLFSLNDREKEST